MVYHTTSGLDIGTLRTGHQGPTIVTTIRPGVVEPVNLFTVKTLRSTRRERETNPPSVTDVYLLPVRREGGG